MDTGVPVLDECPTHVSGLKLRHSCLGSEEGGRNERGKTFRARQCDWERIFDVFYVTVSVSRSLLYCRSLSVTLKIFSSTGIVGRRR